MYLFYVIIQSQMLRVMSVAVLPALGRGRAIGPSVPSRIHTQMYHFQWFRKKIYLGTLRQYRGVSLVPSGDREVVHSLIIGGPCGKHVGLQLGEEAMLVLALANLHIQQMGVYGCVVYLHQTLFNCLGWEHGKNGMGRILE